MAYFDRFDVCEAYLVLEWDYNVSGWLQERPSNRRRNEATHVQLARMQFKARLFLSNYGSLSSNAKEIYLNAALRFKLINRHQYAARLRWIDYTKD